MKLIICLLTLLSTTTLLSQENIDHYQLGGKFASEGKYEKAIEHFNNELEREPNNYYAWFNKALCYSRLKEYDMSIEDFDKAIELKPDYYKAYMNRAIVKRKITDYEGALTDLNKSLEIEENYSWAYYHRGILNEYLENRDQACKDLTRAKELGIERAVSLVKTACSPTRKSNYGNITYLNKISVDKTYGLTEENPIKVGHGILGGPSNQRAFLDLLRDSNRNPVSYVRLGSCCEYKSENGFFGMATLDIYGIQHINSEGEKVDTKLYISFYDYEEPMVPVGFEPIK